jgi:hypothetical protein
MAHLDEHIDPLDSKATLTEVIAKLNEVIEQINHMWHPEDS